MTDCGLSAAVAQRWLGFSFVEIKMLLYLYAEMAAGLEAGGDAWLGPISQTELCRRAGVSLGKRQEVFRRVALECEIDETSDGCSLHARRYRLTCLAVAAAPGAIQAGDQLAESQTSLHEGIDQKMANGSENDPSDDQSKDQVVADGSENDPPVEQYVVSLVNQSEYEKITKLLSEFGATPIEAVGPASLPSYSLAARLARFAMIAMQQGVAAPQVALLLAEQPIDVLELELDYFLFRIEHGGKYGEGQTFPGWLVAAVRQQFGAPRGYRPGWHTWGQVEADPVEVAPPPAPVDSAEGLAAANGHGVSMGDAWGQVLAAMRASVAAATFDAFLAESAAVSFEDGRLTVGVKNAFIRTQLEQRFYATLRRRLAAAYGGPVELRFVVADLAAVL